VANVSIVDTATNTIIGSPLVNYPDFANNARPTAADQLSFSVTIPSNLGSKCATAGACVIQHYWDAASIDQTYESCIDFTVAGSGSAPAPAPSVTRPATTVPTTLQTATRPATSAAAPVTTQAPPAVTSAPAPEEDDCEEL
jgi:predicted carbohydrate-binding protein with CBM5 and CBM33 domain